MADDDAVLRMAATRLFDADANTAATLRAERRALENERRDLERRTARVSGAKVMISRTERDIESRTSPHVEVLRARVAALESRLAKAAGSGARTSKHVRTLTAKNMDPATHPTPGAGDEVFAALAELRERLEAAGVEPVGFERGGPT